MRKTTKFLFAICTLILLFCFGILIADKQSLRTQFIRLHVVANSDSTEDQAEKLAVRDAVMCQLGKHLNGVDDIATARESLKGNIWNINAIANHTLSELGSENIATITFTLEEFNRREYETFSLPAGVYETLRIQIGTGRGRNWWCVVFPELCTQTSSENFKATAVSAGINQGLSLTLSNEPQYEFRFFLLDCIGKIENFLCFS